MRPWLKAGLIGGGVLSLLTVLSGVSTLLPAGVSNLVGCCACIAFLLAYLGVGVLAAYWLTPPRTAGEGAKEGALAGLVAGAIDGVVTVVMALILGATGAYQQMLSQMPPEAVDALEQMGLAGLFSTGGSALGACLGSICGILWAVAMGALGGVVLAALKRE